MTTEFVHLHVHTDFSMLDGACQIDKLAELAAKDRMRALAVTDHGNLCGAVEFYLTMGKHGIKPIIGCEFYLAPGSRRERNQNHPHHKGYHQILYASDLEGYRNLCRLTSLSYQEGYYFKPRIDKELLHRYGRGLIGTSSCIGGEIPALILEGNMEAARRSLAEFVEILGKDNFYLELQDHGMPEQHTANRELCKLAKEFELPLIATNDVHYLLRSHAAAHEVLLCIGTQKTMQDPNRLRFPSQEFYFKTAAEMAHVFKEFPDALRNTMELAEKCNLKLDLNSVNHYPVFRPPNGLDNKAYLTQLCAAGLRERYGITLNDAAAPLSEHDQQIITRMRYEIDAICTLGFSSYFLVVWDFIHHARQQNIPIGPGRGSGAGSLVAYLLRITDIDPLRYNLLFERFINPDRVSPPDFDIDLCERRRVEVINYVRDKYGADSVAQIGTFGTLKAKAVIKDVTRAVGRSIDDGVKLAKLIPNEPKMTLEKALGEIRELRELRDTETWVNEIFTYAEPLEGLSRNMSIHAAGVIIGDQPLTNLVPLALGQGDEVITQYPAGPCEALGLLKMDFLGLRTLTIIQDTCDMVRQLTGQTIDLGRIQLDDKPTFDLINKGNTVSIFQLESSGMRDLCRRFGVHRIEDIIALIALYRPGPMQFLDEFIERKMGKTKVEYDLPSMKPILEETYGIMLYQEQVMQVVQTVAGFTLAQADILRRAMGKKKAEEMKSLYERFETGCKQNSVSAEKAKQIFEKIEMFAGYGFNKSHSAAYGVIAYQTAYLKANYPVAFMCANMSNEIHSAERISELIAECSEMDIKILAPDVNTSDMSFTVDQNAIRFGLAAIKGIGTAAAQAIIATRKDGVFQSVLDVYERSGNTINRRIMEALCQCGAFDCFGLRRAQIFTMLDDIIARSQSSLRDRKIGQETFFDLLDTGGGTNFQELVVPAVPEWERRRLLQYEKELLGFYVTGHPLAEHAEEIRTYGLKNTSQLKGLPENTGTRVGGIIVTATVRYTKRDGTPFAILNVEDLEGSVECLLYSEVYSAYAAKAIADTTVIVEGHISYRNEEPEPRLIVSRLVPIEEAASLYTREIHIRLYEANTTPAMLNDLMELLRRHRGATAVILTVIATTGQVAFVAADERFQVAFSSSLKKAIGDILGENSVLVKPITTVPDRPRTKREGPPTR